MGLHLLCFKIISLIQLAIGIISLDELGNLFGGGIHNQLHWFLLYLITGVTLPLLLDWFAQKIKYIFSKFLEDKYNTK